MLTWLSASTTVLQSHCVAWSLLATMKPASKNELVPGKGAREGIRISGLGGFKSWVSRRATIDVPVLTDSSCKEGQTIPGAVFRVYVSSQVVPSKK